MEVIQSVVRCLNILHELSVNNGASIIDLATSTGLPRGTVHRMVETLSSAGYVRKDPHLGGYWLEAKTTDFGLGYTDQSWILDGGAEIINELRQHIHWCLTLSVPDGDAMVLRIATRLRNPQGGTKTFAGDRKPMGRSSEGHIYMAFCTPEVEEQTLDRIFTEAKGGQEFLANGQAVSRHNAKQLLTTIKQQGYALYDQNFNTCTVSVPILKDKYAIGALSMTFFISGVDQPQLLYSIVPRLQKASHQISISATA